MKQGRRPGRGRVSAKMKQELISAFGHLLRPERVRALKITHASTYVVLGFLLTTCPVENRNYLKDFEAHLVPGKGRLIDYAVVDGRRVSARSGRPVRRQGDEREDRSSAN